MMVVLIILKSIITRRKKRKEHYGLFIECFISFSSEDSPYHPDSRGEWSLGWLISDQGSNYVSVKVTDGGLIIFCHDNRSLPSVHISWNSITHISQYIEHNDAEINVNEKIGRFICPWEDKFNKYIPKSVVHKTL
ncbi:hypothetical protein [Pseudoalteromonas piscicida]|uniref:hypothetical protein n=1 Tax=Pseudoalteromonas piscicida TaxID=43662 RepID=UPI0030A04B40